MDDNILKANFPEKLGMLFEPHRYKVIYGGRGGSRCLQVGTEIIMADGTLCKIEDVKKGELVMGADSKPREVLTVSKGKSQLYRVKQTSAEDYVVNDTHVLSLKKSLSCAKDRGERMPSGKWRRTRGRYPDYPDICNFPIKEIISKSNRWKSLFRGYRAGLITFKPKPVRIDPYILGVWLADGTARELRITTKDQEVIESCREYAQSFGGEVSVCDKKDVNAFDIGFRVRVGNKNPIWQNFLVYNLKNNKHIPQDYIINSEHVRLELLAGMLDGDAHLNHNTYYLTQVKENLARGIKQIADSLGFRTSITRRKFFDKEHLANGHIVKAANRAIWSVSISGNAWRIPCRVKYKALTKEDVKPNKDFLLSQITIEDAGYGEYAGIGIDGDRLFLLADGTVTHNSWSCARALLLFAVQKPIRVLCAREVQKSIRDSVHKLLSDQIQLLGLGSFFEVQEAVIKVRNGGEFTFSGLSTQTIDSIKSMEGVDYVWAEEAHVITKKSWDILIPTIRKEESEIWVTFNPSLESDETFQRFVVNPPPDTVVVKLDYKDNPWFPEVLEKERLYCKDNDPDNYPNIWEGTCKPAVEGAIYYHEVEKAEKENRICNVPYDPMLKVQVVMDLGWADSMAIALVQKQSSELRIIEYIEDSHKTLDYYSAMLKTKMLNWGKVYLPHDGRTKDFKTGKSTEHILKALGWKVEITDGLAVEDGIRITRMVFNRMYFDRHLTARPQKTESYPAGHNRLIECAKRYRRRINTQTQEPGTPLHDEWSHGADTLRYISINADRFTNETTKPMVYHQGYEVLDVAVGY